MRYVVFNNADTIKIGEVQTVDSSEDVRIVDEKNVRIYFLHFCLLRVIVGFLVIKIWYFVLKKYTFV